MSEPLGKVLPFRRKGTTTSDQEEGHQPITFKQFAEQIMANNIPAAAESLTYLFGVPKALAVRCATAFHRKAQTDPELFPKTMSLRAHLEKGENNQTLMVIGECFDIYGPEALLIYAGLNAKFGKSGAK